jgi:hypothetical protein
MSLEICSTDDFHQELAGLGLDASDDPRDGVFDLDDDAIAYAEDIINLLDTVPADETLIHEDSFTDYAQQMAEDLYGPEIISGWPGGYIDWEWAARELRQDYSSVEVSGDTYYYRGD